MSPRRRPRRPRRFAVVGVAAVLVAAGCSADDAASATTVVSTTATDSAPTSASPTTTTAAAPAGDVDQTAPKGANGIKVAEDGSLWIASLASDVIVNVDAGTGRILHRVELPEGSGPDDLVLDDDGTLFWTGYVSGAVGAVAPGASETTVIANVGVGANPIARRADGRIVAGVAGAATGLFVIDPAGDPTPVPLADPGNLNSFDITPQGQLFAPELDSSSVVEVDPENGALVRKVAAVDGTPLATRWHDGVVYVLVLSDAAAVERIDPATGTVERIGPTGRQLADNLAVGDDGRVYVTAMDRPEVTVLGVDGSVERTIRIGG